MKKLFIFLTLIFSLCITSFNLTACASTEQHSHTPDSVTGFCTVCDEPVNATQGILYQVAECGTYAKVVGYVGNLNKVNVAKTYNDLEVTVISDSAFSGCRSLMKLVIPKNITSIGDCAFYNCDSLASVVFEEGSQLTSIGEHGFYDCDMLTSIVIPAKTTSIGAYAFFGCDLLTSATFKNPNGWWYSDSSTAMSGTTISSSSLSNPTIAAGYLSSTYFWKRI